MTIEEHNAEVARRARHYIGALRSTANKATEEGFLRRLERAVDERDAALRTERNADRRP